MSAQINKTVLMSGADFFDNAAAINAFMDDSVAINRERATEEHFLLRIYLEQAGIGIIQVPPPENCQDGVYTANWAVVRGGDAIMASLPNVRAAEVPHAERALRELGFKIHHVPDGLRFSGQGDALACGDYLFMNHGYRTDQAVHEFVGATLGYEVLSLQTIPLLDKNGTSVINAASGWPDSYFYDIDLALSILRGPSGKQKGLIAWCPAAFTPKSRRILGDFEGVEKIEVTLEEAKEAFACNLLSTGETVVMSAHAPNLRAAIESRGLSVITPEMTELSKGGGFIRCTTLTLA